MKKKIASIKKGCKFAASNNKEKSNQLKLNKMKKNVNLPTDAKYDYTDVFGARHYHTTKRIYLVDSSGYATSYSPTEYERIFNNL